MVGYPLRRRSSGNDDPALRLCDDLLKCYNALLAQRCYEGDLLVMRDAGCQWVVWLEEK
jgi:hypothetical protein